MATSTGQHVIIGGLGMLGRALQKQLLAQGKSVRVLDLAPSAEAAANRLVHPNSIDYVPCGLGGADGEDVLLSALRDAETVYSVVTPDVLKGTAAEMKRTNVEGVKRLLNACSIVGVPKFVYASSMAVTNQLIGHKEESENAPLPEWDTYKITYDITKRQGEELVLQHQDDNLQKCALRLGSILAEPGDYMTRTFFDSPGRIISPREGRGLDVISVHDVATAFLLANDKFDTNSDAVNGRAIFVTKDKSNQATSTPQMMEKFAHHMDWTFTTLPQAAFTVMKNTYRTIQSVKGLVSQPSDEETPGFPFDLMLESGDRDLTFDNSLARELLGFQPQETWEDAVERVSREFRELHPELFK